VDLEEGGEGGGGGQLSAAAVPPAPDSCSACLVGGARYAERHPDVRLDNIFQMFNREMSSSFVCLFVCLFVALLFLCSERPRVRFSFILCTDMVK